jgi:hypothetical protein
MPATPASSARQPRRGRDRDRSRPEGAISDERVYLELTDPSTTGTSSPAPATPWAVGAPCLVAVAQSMVVESTIFPRRAKTALVCIWQILDSVTPSTCPISASVKPS